MNMYENKKWMILGIILVLLGFALMIPGFGTIGLYWPGKTVVMRDIIMGSIGAAIAVFGAVYCLLIKGEVL